ncbi:hypothetical protein AYI68_g3898 [Smittium mucronatum]|uniref:Uncharacterized protein n=1 Tax=Smittium mucronatum TaxID=133383 RepID=A0A1R0GYN2_9FUNG|nr:hypothetical protein AYI68_g3898 [Smittium mucronatum]
MTNNEFQKILSDLDFSFENAKSFLSKYNSYFKLHTKNTINPITLLALGLINCLLPEFPQLKNLQNLYLLSTLACKIFLPEILGMAFNSFKTDSTSLNENLMKFLLDSVTQYDHYPEYSELKMKKINSAKTLISAVVEARNFNSSLLQISNFLEMFRLDYVKMAILSSLVGINEYVPFFYELSFWGPKDTSSTDYLLTETDDLSLGSSNYFVLSSDDSIHSEESFRAKGQMNKKKIDTHIYNSPESIHEKSIVNISPDSHLSKMNDYLNTRPYNILSLNSSDRFILKDSYFSMRDNESYITMISYDSLKSISERLISASDFNGVLMVNESFENSITLQSKASDPSVEEMASNYQDPHGVNGYSDSLITMGLNSLAFSNGIIYSFLFITFR